MEMDPRRPPPRMEPATPGEAIRLEPAAPAPEGAGLKPCAECGRLIPGDSRRCVYCGHGGGSTPVPDAGDEPRPCAFCQYDLRGAPTSRCPECGRVQPGRNRRSRDALTSADAYRAEVRKAWILLVAPLLLSLAAVTAFTRSPATLVNSLTVFGSLYASSTVVYLSASLYLGLDSGLGFALLRLGSCVSATIGACVAVIGGLWAFGCFAYILLGVPLLVYAALLVDLFDHDYSDAVLLSLVTVGAGLATWFTLLHYAPWI